MKVDQHIIALLKQGEIGVIPTDTLYGLVASVRQERSVEELYRLKQRKKDKPLIVLIADLVDLNLFGIELLQKEKELLNNFWPGKVSVIFPCAAKKFTYLHRGTNALAFRIPALNCLRDLLRATGPLVAPSANPEGLAPAQTLAEAKEYFGDQPAFYLDGGSLLGEPSALITFQDGKIKVLRGKLEK
ncbi:MAG: threonylcarbamoyl-AMP synthase [Candidatus Abawacabacteria bacterium RIFCSPHIGHO2_01_FULL_46_8]|uniref:L-threonylcarbamoyladenylate synthase n=1 Tax=Candidatus Abawacabacteria bacterium RIFCSPHIGHO2_01_FULL_46_8 TaxID=1817815 RepID=A0A1F4XJG7_9BACT|nr:MAG: threonylcarbamoyl-AMP synthase [Candidatus Abawacabacteria bacterium RIFCSPHIGHO2_01_FULL_46_8]